MGMGSRGEGWGARRFSSNVGRVEFKILGWIIINDNNWICAFFCIRVDG